MMVRARRGRTSLISSDDLETFNGQIPSMSLKSTAEFFVNRLSSNDTNKLATALQKLNGKTIKVGTTCSGTDVIIPVLSRTFETLSRIFNETRFVSLICYICKSHSFQAFVFSFFERKAKPFEELLLQYIKTNIFSVYTVQNPEVRQSTVEQPSNDTVDGRNLGNQLVDSLSHCLQYSTRFYTFQVVQDFFRQPYHQILFFFPFVLVLKGKEELIWNWCIQKSSKNTIIYGCFLKWWYRKMDGL